MSLVYRFPLLSQEAPIIFGDFLIEQSLLRLGLGAEVFKVGGDCSAMGPEVLLIDVVCHVHQILLMQRTDNNLTIKSKRSD